MDPALATYLPTLLWAIFVGATLLSITLGALLAYHWYRYAMNNAIAITALIIYTGISLFLLACLFAATIAIAI